MVAVVVVPPQSLMTGESRPRPCCTNRCGEQCWPDSEEPLGRCGAVNGCQGAALVHQRAPKGFSADLDGDASQPQWQRSQRPVGRTQSK